MPPGAVVFTGQKKVEEVIIHHLRYDESDFSDDSYTGKTIREKLTEVHDKVDWFDVRGLHDVSLIESLGSVFDIHALALEDIADTQQRPKFDEYQNGLFAVVKALHFDKGGFKIKAEQVAIYFRKGLILTFQEDETDLLKAVRDRIRNRSGRIRTRGSDYLCYAILDALVDQYFVVIDDIEEEIEQVEERLLTNPDDRLRSDIHRLKKEVVIMRKSIGPLREAIGRFAKSESPLIEEGTSLFIRDLYDHTIQVMDMVETYRDVLNGLQDLYISEISLKMNQVMQVLTIITTIFVPLSFLAGLYGMNFEYIPELNFKYGYFFLLGVMALIFVGALAYFRNKRWL